MMKRWRYPIIALMVVVLGALMWFWGWWGAILAGVRGYYKVSASEAQQVIGVVNADVLLTREGTVTVNNAISGVVEMDKYSLHRGVVLKVDGGRVVVWEKKGLVEVYTQRAFQKGVLISKKRSEALHGFKMKMFGSRMQNLTDDGVFALGVMKDSETFSYLVDEEASDEVWRSFLKPGAMVEYVYNSEDNMVERFFVVKRQIDLVIDGYGVR